MDSSAKKTAWQAMEVENQSDEFKRGVPENRTSPHITPHITAHQPHITRNQDIEA